MKKVLIFLSIACMAVIFTACKKDNGPEKVAEQYLSFLQKEDMAKGLDLFYFKQELAKNDRDDLVQMYNEKVKEENLKKGGIASYEITNVKRTDDGQSAVVGYKLNYGDGTSQEDSMKMIKVAEKWWIDSEK